MTETKSRSTTSLIVGLLTLVSGLAAFTIPHHHAGPYGIPGRGLIGGILCLASAAVLLTKSAPMIFRRVVLIASPLALFLALYAALSELEEVVVLYAQGADLHLWIVDSEGDEWVSMPRSKAATYSLDGAELDLLRDGETRCVVPRIIDDPIANRRTFDLRQEKYAIQRFGGVIGMFGDGPGPQTITLRLDPCR